MSALPDWLEEFEQEELRRGPRPAPVWSPTVVTCPQCEHVHYKEACPRCTCPALPSAVAPCPEGRPL